MANGVLNSHMTYNFTERILLMTKNISLRKSFFRSFLHSFLRCGLAGWCLEILFTALGSLRRRELKLKGNTSIWMFPIYGCAALIGPLRRLLKKWPLWMRGFTYMTLIYCVEYLSGKALQKKGLCPWDYGRSRFHVNRTIRLDYAPLWFFAGLLFERLSRDED